jgi:hypothetical protein
MKPFHRWKIYGRTIFETRKKMDPRFLNKVKMRRIIITCMLLLGLSTQVYPEILTYFPDMAKPTELRMDDRYIYISDQYSVFIYDLNTYKLVKKLCRKGEGPEEFKAHPKIAFAPGRLILFDNYKVILYSSDYKPVREMKLPSTSDRVNPVEDNFVLSTTKAIDNNEYIAFTLYNGKLEKIKELVLEPIDRGVSKFLITPWPFCRSHDDKIFIARPHKGFYIDVFDEYGKKLYHIQKEVEKIKAEEMHREAYKEEILYFLGRRLYEKAGAKGVYKKPMREFLPPIKRFWVIDNRIYVKTYDITDIKEKYVIMDLKGNILKTVFLPKTYREILTFRKDKFYYLQESEDDDGWVLHSEDL